MPCSPCGSIRKALTVKKKLAGLVSSSFLTQEERSIDTF